jgi:hypothetical protein
MEMSWLPTSLKHYVYAVLALTAFYGWVGWLEPPGMRANQLRDEWVKAHAEATARIEQQGKEILILQERESVTKGDIGKINFKLDDISRVLYKLDRRTQ